MNKNPGLIVLNLAVALYLLATGILGLNGSNGRFFGSNNDEISTAVNSLFNKSNNFTEALIIILAVLAIAAGVFVLLKFFGIEIPVTELLLTILAIVWVVFIILIDIVNPLAASKGPTFVEWMRSFGAHAMALGGILLATERFGS